MNDLDDPAFAAIVRARVSLLFDGIDVTGFDLVEQTKPSKEYLYESGLRLRDDFIVFNREVVCRESKTANGRERLKATLRSFTERSNG